MVPGVYECSQERGQEQSFNEEDSVFSSLENGNRSMHGAPWRGEHKHDAF